MPAAEPASVAIDGDTLRFSGALTREAVPGLWKQAVARVGGISRIDLAAVERVDSAGVALLAELAAHAATAPAIDGTPEGLAELREAYRLAPSLAFSG